MLKPSEVGAKKRDPLHFSVSVVYRDCDLAHYPYQKCRAVVTLLGGMLKKMFIEEHGEELFRGFTYSTVRLRGDTIEEIRPLLERRQNLINLVFFIRNFGKAMDGFTLDACSVIYVSLNTFDYLPRHYTDSTEINKYTKVQLFVLDRFLGLVAHEMFHALGAYHARTGIMSGNVEMLTNVENKLFGELVLNPFTDIITKEILLKAFTNNPPTDTEYQYRTREDGKLWYQSDSAKIAVYAFISRKQYTSKFGFFSKEDATQAFILTPPSEWDALLVAHHDGPIILVFSPEVLAVHPQKKFKKCF